MLDTSLPPLGLDDEAATTIHHKVARLIGRYGFTDAHREDLEQDIALDLVRRWRRFDPARAQATTFIARCIEHRIWELICRRGQAYRESHRLCRFEEDAANDGGDVPVDHVSDASAEDARRRIDLRIDLAAATRSLPPRLKRICDLLPEHAPFAIARLMGVSKSSVYRDIATIRAAFTSAGLSA